MQARGTRDDVGRIRSNRRNPHHRPTSTINMQYHRFKSKHALYVNYYCCDVPFLAENRASPSGRSGLVPDLPAQLLPQHCSLSKAKSSRAPVLNRRRSGIIPMRWVGGVDPVNARFPPGVDVGDLTPGVLGRWKRAGMGGVAGLLICRMARRPKAGASGGVEEVTQAIRGQRLSLELAHSPSARSRHDRGCHRDANTPKRGSEQFPAGPFPICSLANHAPRASRQCPGSRPASVLQGIHRGTGRPCFCLHRGARPLR